MNRLTGRLRWRLPLLLLIAAPLFPASCGASTVIRDGVEIPAEEAARIDFEALSQALEDGAEDAESRMYKFLADNPEAEQVPVVRAWLAKRHFAAKRFTEAAEQYRILAEDFSDHPLAAGASRQLAICNLELGNTEEAREHLDKELEEADPEERTRKAADLAEELYNNGRIAESLHYYALFHEAASEAERDFIKRRVIEALDSRLDFQALKRLYVDLPKSRFPAGYLSYKLAKVYYHTREYNACQEMLARMVSDFPDHPLASEAQGFLQRIEERFKVEARTVGVILPLSGKFKVYGEKVLHAIELASEAFKKEGITLAIRDSAGDPDQAAKMVDELVYHEHAVAIVGPLMSATARAAALKSEELSVPLLALSQASGLPDLGRYVFRHFLTDEMMARSLAEYAVKDLGYKKFGILYPDHPYGRGLKDAFWDALIPLGAEVTACEPYPHDATTFANSVKKLVGRYYAEARSELWAFRSRYKKKYKSPTRWRKALEDFLHKDLPPVVDFEALFIPDYYKTVSLVGPALAFEDIDIQDDSDYWHRKRIEKYKALNAKKDFLWKLKEVRLLGANGWNNEKLLERCDKYCYGAIFVDAWDPRSGHPKVSKFMADYRETFKEDPGPIEAFGFDTIRLLKAVLDKAKPTSRQALRNALLTMEPFDGVTGLTRFRANGDADKQLTFFKVDKEEIEILERAPASDEPEEKKPEAQDS